ncbi:hypothetical protein E4U09_000796 [Claviceps aff. purpurea]|uniref:Uncharacterized protein n=1 Tax=Claviceps aff. purpurea TaxID=1967640 RepID=A0A9P7QID2_9HYPO|nr:hypothetical protein E4U09_000796 [Claviceps aff. purpurea]
MLFNCLLFSLLPLLVSSTTANTTNSTNITNITFNNLPNTLQIQQIAPKSLSCLPCSPDCRTAHQATPFIASSLKRYKIHDLNTTAALLALMAFESVDFRYKHNVFPGRPGQGTVNMQSANFNLLYAKSIPALKPLVASIPSVEGLKNETLNAILGLVTPDEYNFGSAAWFLVKECGRDVLRALQRDLEGGFGAYMKCVGVEVSEERRLYLERAKKAFGLDS